MYPAIQTTTSNLLDIWHINVFDKLTPFKLFLLLLLPATIAYAVTPPSEKLSHTLLNLINQMERRLSTILRTKWQPKTIPEAFWDPVMKMEHNKNLKYIRLKIILRLFTPACERGQNMSSFYKGKCRFLRYILGW